EPGRAHRLFDTDFRGEVKDGLDALVAQKGADIGGASDVALDEPRLRVHGVAMPGGEVVERDDVMAGVEQRLDHVRAAITGTARDEEPHRSASLDDERGSESDMTK